MTATAAVEILNEDYHRLPGLSSSGARKLLPPSCPAIFKWEQDHPVFKDEFDLGSAAHKLVLGDQTAELVVIDADSWRTNAAKTARDEARQAHKIPLLVKDFEVVEEMAGAIHNHPVAASMFNPANGKPEQSLQWEDPATGVRLRCRFDWLPNPVDGQRLIIPDYKTAHSADSRTFARSAANLGYAQQAAWYIDGAKACGLDDDPVFLFVVQENHAPYLVNVIELDSLAIEVGRQLNRKAITLYAECAANDTWPGYSTGVELVSLPGWYGAQYDPEQDYAA